MSTAEEVAEQVAQRAAAICAPMKREMEMAKWPAEFRRIVWDAVAHHAQILANEAARQT